MLPSRQEFSRALGTFSLRAQGIFFILLVIGGASLLGLYWKLNRDFGTPIAAPGGTLVEGIVGTPRFINPLLATSDADRDLAALVYSGLLRADGEGGLIPDLAERYDVSPDGRTYTVTLRPDLTWHDGVPVTAADVVFTITKAKDPALKSPRRATWEGVEVTALNDREIQFRLRQPYAPFLGNLTLGIIPEHLWGTIEVDSFAWSSLNTEGSGTGPYRVTNIKRDAAGIPTRYDLKAFSNFALGAPKLNRIEIRVYPNETALLAAFNRGEIDSMSAIAPAAAVSLKNEPVTIVTAPLPRVFGVFFNQNISPALADLGARRALEAATPRQTIVTEVLAGFATPINGPLSDSLVSATTSADDPTAILAKNGWQKNSTGVYQKTIGGKLVPLAFTLATSDTPELQATAEILRRVWTKLGATVTVQVYEAADLNQNVIRPRRYEALLFGEVIGRGNDLFPFWHSSQRLDPGLNVALYASNRVDKLLEAVRATSSPTVVTSLTADMTREITSDVPAVFLYSPRFIYVLPRWLHGVALPPVMTAADRFTTVYRWYVNTDYVWKIFSPAESRLDHS